MADTCVLRLFADGQVEWVLVDATGTRRSAVSRGTLGEAASAFSGRRVTVLVPGAEVTLAQPDVPVRSGTRLLQVVPYALEEQLAGDIDALHFAVGRPDGSKVPTAAVERSRLAGWLSALASAGIRPEALYADAMALPDNPGHVVVLCDGPRLFVRRPHGLPIVLEADPLALALRVAGLPPAAGEPEETHVIVYATAADWQHRAASFEALRPHLGSLKVQLLAEGATALLASSAVTQPPFSLLQGEFSAGGDWQTQWQRWRVAALLLGALIVVHVAALAIGWWRMAAEDKKLDQGLTALAQDALPDIKNPTRLPNLRAMVEGRVNAAQAVGHTGLIGTLSGVARALGQTPNVVIQNLNYRDGSTDLTVEAPDVGTLDRFQQALGQQGYQASLQGATQRESRYQGHVKLKGSG
jgi:general secretion pathway protein L